MCWGSYGGDSEKAINTVPTNTWILDSGIEEVVVRQSLYHRSWLSSTQYWTIVYHGRRPVIS